MSRNSEIINGLSNLPMYALRSDLFVSVAAEIESLEAEIESLDSMMDKCYKDNQNLSIAIDRLKGELSDSRQSEWDKQIKLLELQDKYDKLKYEYDGLVGLNHCIKGILGERED